jgi:type IV pilus biogenesis protein CpaD/CtpE
MFRATETANPRCVAQDNLSAGFAAKPNDLFIPPKIKEIAKGERSDVHDEHRGKTGKQSRREPGANGNTANKNRDQSCETEVPSLEILPTL